MSATETPRTTLIKELRLLLGGQLVDVELDIEHYNLAVTMAVDRLRQRTDGSKEESHIFLTMQPGQQEYQLPEEVEDVRKIYRRGVGANTGGGTNFDPFEAAFSNIYLLQSGRTGGLATWEFFSQYQETIGRVFGSEINFIWRRSSHTISLIRKITAQEDVMVQVWNRKPEFVLLTDTYTKPWIRDYALAQSKMMLGEGRGKFTSGLPGPNGTVIFNGEQLKAEAIAEFDRLEQEVQNFNLGEMGMPFIIG